MPNLKDPAFEKVVVYICEHSDKGAIGLIVNRPTEYNLQFIFDQLGIDAVPTEASDQPVLFGGPVQQDRGFVIHRPMENYPANLGINEEICISTSQEILRRMARGQGPSDSIVTLGYAGWAGDQLDEEIKQNIWLTCAANETIMYDTAFEDRWQCAIDSLGFDISHLVVDVGSA